MTTIEEIKEWFDGHDDIYPYCAKERALDLIRMVEELQADKADLLFIAKEQEDAHVAANMRVSELQAQVGRIALKAQIVMDYLEEHGGSIVPHLLDTDDNPGQYLREEIAAIKGEES